VALGERDSALAVWPAFRDRGGSPFEGWLLEASTLATVGRKALASAALDSAAKLAPSDSVSAMRLNEVRRLVERPDGP